MIGNIFKAYDVRAVYPDPLDEDAAWKVGYAAGQFFRDENGGKPGTVLVSRDMRPSSVSLASAMSHGVRAAGHDVVDIGMCDTPFLYYAIPELDALGGIQTTASHNPVQYNGFKISGKEARPIGADSGLKKIQQIAEGLIDTHLPAHGKYQQLDLTSGYRKHIHRFLAPLKRKLKIYIDASNGMAGKMIPAVFHEVPNLEIIPLNFEVTGSFVHEPNPLVLKNMRPTQQGVQVHHAAFGACFDGDADRCIVCDDEAQIIGCDHLTALLAGHFVQQEHQRGNEHPTIVYDLRSSKVVPETIVELGAMPKRSRVGHVFMKANLRETGAVFGGELSGHFYFRDNHFADSGAIALASLISVLAHTDRSLSDLLPPLRKYFQSGEINFQVADKEAVQAKLKAKYQAEAKIDDLDGVTIDCFEGKGWWFNVRASNTEPLLRLNAEAKDAQLLKDLLGELEPELGTRAGEH